MASTLIGKIECAIVNYPPAKRRRFAIHMLIWSVVAMIVNVALYLTGVVDQGSLILVTLILSWLAITITAADLVATTDVREAETTPTEDHETGYAVRQGRLTACQATPSADVEVIPTDNRWIVRRCEQGSPSSEHTTRSSALLAGRGLARASRSILTIHDHDRVRWEDWTGLSTSVDPIV